MIYGLLLSGAVRAAAVLAVGLVAYALLSRAAAATRRFVLVLTLGATIVVPVAAAVGPRWTVEAPAALSVFAHESDENANERRTDEQTDGHRADDEPASGHALAPRTTRRDGRHRPRVARGRRGAARSCRRVRSSGAGAIARRATRVESAPWIDAMKHAAAGRPVEVRASSELDSPAVTGLFRPTIVVPHGALDWPLERCRLVLAHELAHVRRRDVLVQAIADVACAIHWCNPLVWICARRLRVEREIAADDAVLAAGVRPSRYAEELVAVATSVATPSAALAMAERSSLEARVASILASRLARAPLARSGDRRRRGCGSGARQPPPRARRRRCPRLKG